MRYLREMTFPSENPDAPVRRNDRIIDRWSAVHVLSGALLGLVLPPPAALIILIGWEPFEVFLLSPFLLKRGIVYGYEAWQNSLSDIVFDLLGFLVGYAGLASILGLHPHVFGL